MNKREISVFGWQDWQDKPQKVADSLEALRVACGAECVVFLPKIGIDGGSWTAGNGRFPDTWLATGRGPLAPLDLNPRIVIKPYVYIGYDTPTQQDYADIIKLLRVRGAGEIVLNLEEKWFGATNAEMRSYALGLGNALAGAGFGATKVGGSTVSSWDGKYGNFFPYEGLAEAVGLLGGTMYDQWYWRDGLRNPQNGTLIGNTDPDAIAATARRLPRGVRLVPILVGIPSSDMGEWPTAEVAALARRGLDALGDRIAGWSSWVWRPDWRAEGQIAAYALFPAEPVIVAESKPPTLPLGDPGFPGIVQPDRTLRIGDVAIPDGYADAVERLALQVHNKQTDTHYWVEWDKHQWARWQGGYLPLPAQ